MHSWDSPHRISNYMLFKLSRHPDHHQNPMKPYQVLLTDEKGPLLPQGYATMVLMANFPSTWFKVMNPIVLSYREGKSPSDDLLKSTNKEIIRFINKSITIIIGMIGIQFLLNYLI